MSLFDINEQHALVKMNMLYSVYSVSVYCMLYIQLWQQITNNIIN